MKKVIFGLMALAIGLFSSCSNDEIAIDAPEAPVKDALTITIDLSNFFSSYNYDDTKHNIQIAEAFRTFNSEGGFHIHLNTLIYNKQTEELVDSIVKDVVTTNSITEIKTLPIGEYYAISMLSFGLNNTPSFWYVTGRSKLSTAKLAPYVLPDGYEMWGILSQSIESFSVSRNQQAHVNTTPSPLGTLVYFYCQNFQFKDEATYGTVADNGIRNLYIFTQRQAISYNLDPSATSKYNYKEETGGNQWYWMQNFEPKNFNTSWTYFQSNLYGYHYVLEPQQRNVFGYKLQGETEFHPEGEQTVDYKPGTVYLAYWDYFQVGAPYLGIADNNHWHSYNLPDPTPTDKYYESPYLGWGESLSSVKSSVEALGFTLSYESDDYLIYAPKYKERYTYYGFTDSALNWSLVCFETTAVSLTDLNDYVAGLPGVSYDHTSDKGYVYYTTSDGKTIIVVFEYTYDDGSKDYNVEYYPASSSQTRGINIRSSKEASLKAMKLK